MRKKIILLIGLYTLASQFFLLTAFFLPVKNANAAACTWAITNYWVSPTTALRTDTVTFNADVSRKGSPSECASQDKFKVAFDLINKNYGFENLVTSGDIPVSGDITPANATFDLNILTNNQKINNKTPSWYSLKNINQIPIRARVIPKNGTEVSKEIGAILTISGESSYSTDKSVASVIVNFDKASVKSDPKTEVPLKVYVKVQSQELSKLVADKVKILTYINGKWNGLQITRDKTDCGNTYCLTDGKSTYQDIPNVNSDAGFKDGDNEIRVDIYPSNSNQVAATGKGTVRVSGIGTTAADNSKTPSPDNKDTVNINQNTGQVAYDCNQANPDPRYCLINPLPSDSLTGMVLLIVRGFIYVVGIWSVLFIVVGGFRMVIAQGNEEAYQTAQKTITWAVLGLIVALLSFSIVAVVQNFFGAKTPNINLDNPSASVSK